MARSIGNMAIKQETVVLNEFGLTRRTRTTSKGTKDRYTIQIQSEPIIHNFSALELGKAPAEAIKNEIVRQIRGVSETASEATRKKRQQAAAVMAGRNAKGKGASASDARTVKRYSGGRSGTTLPNQSDKLFNDSGRLALITIQPNRAYDDDSAWEVNVPANRLDPSTFGDLGKFKEMVERLQTYVPALGGDTASLLESDKVDKALRESIELCLGQALARNKELRSALRKSQFEFASQLISGFLNVTL